MATTTATTALITFEEKTWRVPTSLSYEDIMKTIAIRSIIQKPTMTDLWSDDTAAALLVAIKESDGTILREDLNVEGNVVIIFRAELEYPGAAEMLQREMRSGRREVGEWRNFMIRDEERIEARVCAGKLYHENIILQKSCRELKTRWETARNLNTILRRRMRNVEREAEEEEEREREREDARTGRATMWTNLLDPQARGVVIATTNVTRGNSGVSVIARQNNSRLFN